MTDPRGASADASRGETEEEEPLAPEEERFVEAFVEYWIRRGRAAHEALVTTEFATTPAGSDPGGPDVVRGGVSRPSRSRSVSRSSSGCQSRVVLRDA